MEQTALEIWWEKHQVDWTLDFEGCEIIMSHKNTELVIFLKGQNVLLEISGKNLKFKKTKE